MLGELWRLRLLPGEILALGILLHFGEAILCDDLALGVQQHEPRSLLAELLGHGGVARDHQPRHAGEELVRRLLPHVAGHEDDLEALVTQRLLVGGAESCSCGLALVRGAGEKQPHRRLALEGHRRLHLLLALQSLRQQLHQRGAGGRSGGRGGRLFLRHGRPCSLAGLPAPSARELAASGGPQTRPKRGR